MWLGSWLVLKYVEALAHSDALLAKASLWACIDTIIAKVKNVLSILLMWKFLETKKICPFFCLLYIDFNHYDQQQQQRFFGD